MRTSSQLRKTFIVLAMLMTGIELMALWLIISFPTGLSGTYYLNSSWQSPAWKQDVLDSELSHVSETFQQVRAQSQNRFSVEWKGYLNIAETGTYTFFLLTKGRGQLFIDDVTVVEFTSTLQVEEHQGLKYLSKGLHRFVLRYAQDEGDSWFSMSWMRKLKEHIRRRPNTPPCLRMCFSRLI